MKVRLLTPPGRGAVAVVELAGPDARARADGLAAGPLPAAGQFGLVRLAHAGEALDEALAVARPDGAIELHLHGSPPLVARVLQLAGANPEPASETLEERAWTALAGAPCEAAARVLLDQAQGALRRACEKLAGADEDELRRGVRALAERARVARRLLVPARVVLAGPVNAGKSTLFNTLLAEGRAIVSAERGTTRDVLVERAALGPWPVTLVDTAGERDGLGAGARADVEREGQRRGRTLRAEADLVLWLEPVDGPGELAPPPGATLLRTRADCAPAGSAPGGISALREPEGARRRALELFRAAFDLPAGDPWEPGAAVPFEAAQERSLAGLLARPPAAIRRGLATLLE